MTEPVLTVRRPPPPVLRRRGFLRVFLPTALLALSGVIVLLVSGTAALPFQPLTVLQGKMASKEDFFNDPEVRRILLRHHIRVQVTAMGSRDVANTSLDSYDFAFPSGQPTAELIQRRTVGNPDVKPHRPIISSPLVLATYRKYADALFGAKVATLREGLYYDLDFTAFVGLIRDGVTWDKLGLKGNDNPVAAHSSSACTSNGGGNYLGLVAYAVAGQPVANEAEADKVATKVAPLIRASGLPLKSPKQTYFSAEGAATAPIIVMYEHQYLQYQIATRRAKGKVDEDRVLLYPDTGVITEPGFISFNPAGRRLGDLLENDPDLHRRAVELGFRVIAANDLPPTRTLAQQLAVDRVQAPVLTNDTKALLPASVDVFERLIKEAADCDKDRDDGRPRR